MLTTIGDLGIFSPYTGINPLGINNSGQVVGELYDSSVSAGFLYNSSGSLSSLTSIGDADIVAEGINDSGKVVGIATLNAGGTAAFFDNGGLYETYLPLEGAYGVNASGSVVGYGNLGGQTDAAVLYSGSSAGPTYLGTFGGTYSTATAINASGQIVGLASYSNGNDHAFYDNGSGLRDLGTFGGADSAAYAINSSGQVVGYAEQSNGDPQAFLYYNGVTNNLGTLGGLVSYAYGINDSGEVVGNAATSAGVLDPFLYSGGKMVDLNTLLPANSGWTLSTARAINNNGQIVGMGIHNGASRAYLLTLTPATKLVFTSEPPLDVQQNGTFSLTVSAEDPTGSVDTTYDGQISISLASNPGGASLDGLIGQSASHGVATFSGLTLTQAGNGYVIQASATGLSFSDSSAINVQSTPTRLAFTTEPPASARAGSAFGVTVAVENSSGVVDTSYDGPVTIGLSDDPEFAPLNGQLIELAFDGYATFNGLSINSAGAPFEIEATANGLQPAFSSPFTVTNHSEAATDYDGDGRSDVGVFQPTTSTFYILGSSFGPKQGQFGQGTNSGGDPIPFVGDFDGDGKADIGVFQPATSTFDFSYSTGGYQAIQFGSGTNSGGDPIPFVGDFDGDGKSDFGVYQPSTSTFYFKDSTAGNVMYQFGQGTLGGAIPAPIPFVGDFDGDGRADFGVFQPSTSTFYFKDSAAGNVMYQFGQGTLGGGYPIPIVGDFDGDGRSDFGVFQPGTSTFYFKDSSAGSFPAQFGQGTLSGGYPVPIVGDYDGDGRTDFGVFQPGTSTFYMLDSTLGLQIAQFGQGTLTGGDPIALSGSPAYLQSPSVGILSVHIEAVAVSPSLNVGLASASTNTLGSAAGASDPPISPDFWMPNIFSGPKRRTVTIFMDDDSQPD